MSNIRERQIVMSREMARRWILKKAHAEYRFWVYGTGGIRYLPNLMRSLRDGKIAMEGVPSISDLGIQESFDAVELWSTNKNALVQLQQWFEKRGYETTGVW